MDANLMEYVNKRIEELTAYKSETLQSLKKVTKTVEELNATEEKEISEKKMTYYFATGASAELQELKRVLNS